MPEPEYGLYSAAKCLLDQYKINPLRIHTCNNPETNYQFAAAGLGITLTLAVVLDSLYPDLRDKLAFCTLNTAPVERRGLIAWRRGSSKEKLIHEFADLSVKVLNERYPDGT